jgi:hypothetical protein
VNAPTPRLVLDVIAVRLVDACMDHLFSVTDDGKIWIVGHNEQLPPLLRMSNARNEITFPGRVVKRMETWMPP